MSDPTCPVGTVLLKSGQGVHPDEPTFCIDATETTQAADTAFWAKRQQSGYKKRPQPAGALAGPKKPAVLRTWAEARTYCQATYPGGDLPTERQWEQACGGKEYCTASGTLNHREAIYDAAGPANVGATLANSQGVYDMTGNVLEWTLDDYEPGSPFNKTLRSGQWNFNYPVILRAAFRHDSHPGNRGRGVGFRCVARPQNSKK